MSATIDLPAISLGDLVVSGKGAKSSPLSYIGRPVTWTPGPQGVAYEPSSFSGEDTSRVNLVMRPPPETLRQLEQLDEAIVRLATQQSAKLFGKALSEAEVRARYSPVVKRNDKGYPPSFKCKINVAGRNMVRCWDLAKNPRDLPASWITCAVSPKLTLRSLWMMSKEFGVLIEASDVLVDEAAEECPF